MTGCKNHSKNCFERFIASSIVKFVKRIIPMMQAIWMYADMILDVRQTYKYYDHTFNPDGKYSKWALKNYLEKNLENNQTTNDNLETVHPGYFYTAIISWILPPFLYSAEIFFIECFAPILGGGIDVFKNINHLILEFGGVYEIKPLFENDFFNFIFYLIYFPCDVIISCIYIYGLIPLSVLMAGYIIARDGKIDGEDYLVGLVSADELPWMKLFENLGEAIPQAILSLVFLINNFSFEVDSSFIPIPTTCISLFFSIGSIMMGLYSGCSVCWCSKSCK